MSLLTVLLVLGADPPCLPPPPDDGRARARAELGRTLFFDPRLSASGTLSCASCHPVEGGASGDGRPVSVGVGGRTGARNAPTVWNAGLRRRLFWDGRAGSLEEQAQGPLLNPVEMGMADGEAVVRVVAGLEGYRVAFARAFGDGRPRQPPLTFEELLRALADFERTLVTCPSPFDVAIAGGPDLRSPEARRGWERFQALGCLGCHGTPTFSGQEVFARFPQRTVEDLDRVLGLTRDRGRGALALEGWEDQRWRVPSLRNVALTGPYLHHGGVRALEQVVRVMGRAQLARSLDDEEVRDLVAFLESLTGPRPEVRAPELPAR